MMLRKTGKPGVMPLCSPCLLRLFLAAGTTAIISMIRLQSVSRLIRRECMVCIGVRIVPYQECAIKEKPGEMAPQCKAAGVKLFPSWQFGTNAPVEGRFSLEELSDKTGCSLP